MISLIQGIFASNTLLEKSSPKRHCSKCYCYVCEEIAPCKMWKKNPKRHCDATDKDDKWKLERKYRKKLPGCTRMDYHNLTVSASNLFPDGPNAPIRGFSGGLICDSDGNWVIGISMRLLNNVDPSDHSVSFYIAFLEGLQLAWSKGLRCLEVKLGFVFHNDFWNDFSTDAVSRKLRLCVDHICCRDNQTMAILKQVEDYLNREWFISVKNTESIEEETGAFTVATLAVSQAQSKKVYDFRTYPLPPETYTRDIKGKFL
uniref:RNase H type-1 domain-containing protein n=2 Tax=Chenopodium quinoa TaxID=63459 RepID=A0A803LJC3_CHEQI